MNTKEKIVGVFWGVVLILLGAVFLITGRTSFQINDPWLGLAVMAGISLVFFASYFLSGVDKWGWLFPAFIFAGVALTVLLTIIFPEPQGGWVAAPILLSIAVPFLVAYLLDRKKREWALIPAFVLGGITLIAAFADVVQGELIGTFVLLMIAVAFLAVYLRNRARKWALIVFGVMVGISLIPLLTTIANGDIAGSVVMFLFALAFFIVFFTRTQRWWALIPAGVFTTLGVVTLLTFATNTERLGGEPMAGQIAGAVFLLGLALTFLALWLLRANAKTAWAIYPAAVLGILGLVTLVAGQAGNNIIWPILLIAGGALILYMAMRKRLV